ncbi:uncharacterized protein [Drosophila kikkawai]|uniref:Uncharacterized protein n=1 Tax=Drosophila kikkawai TaxID=30033 RepID=A0ABM4GP42_DROKI
MRRFRAAFQTQTPEARTRRKDHRVWTSSEQREKDKQQSRWTAAAMESSINSGKMMEQPPPWPNFLLLFFSRCSPCAPPSSSGHAHCEKPIKQAEDANRKSQGQTGHESMMMMTQWQSWHNEPDAEWNFPIGMRSFVCELPAPITTASNSCTKIAYMATLSCL